MDEIVINGILYLPITADELQHKFGITIDAEVCLVYIGPETGAFTDEIVEVPESVTVEGQTVPVVGFMGGYLVLATQNQNAAASVTEVILPSSTLFLTYGFSFFTNLQKITCYAESVPKLSSEVGGPTGIDFEGTPGTKELHIPSGSDYTVWENDTRWSSVNEIYDGFVEIVGDLKYKETGENTVALIGYDETFTATSLTIPSSITHEGNTYTVTEIKKDTFKNYTGLTSITIPNSVTSIGTSAFQNCSSLTSITIPNSVTSIGTSAFHGCSSLNTLNFNAINCNDFTSNNPFTNCPISVINIGEKVQKIPSYFAYKFNKLTSIDIPNSVTSIGGYAFSYCSS